MRSDLFKAVVVLALVIGAKFYFSNRGRDLSQSGLLPLKVVYLQGGAPRADQPMLLEFWATWCGPCRESIAHLNALNVKYHPRGLGIVGVTHEEAGVVQAFRERVAMNYVVAIDPEAQYARALHVREIPHAFLVDKDGKIVWEGDPRVMPESEIEKTLD